MNLKLQTLTSRLLALLLAALLLPAAWAGPGHDHGYDHGAAAAAPPALPRFEAQSDLFELVGIVDGSNVTLYLDRYADNAPITDAAIEIELLGGGDPLKLAAAPQPDGTYKVAHERLAQPGEYALQVNISAGQEVDILAANLTIKAAEDGVHGHPQGFGVAPWLALGAALLIVVVFIASRRRGRARSSEVPA